MLSRTAYRLLNNVTRWLEHYATMARYVEDENYAPIVRDTMIRWSYDGRFKLEKPGEIENAVLTNLISEVLIYASMKYVSHLTITLVGAGGTFKTTYAILASIHAISKTMNMSFDEAKEYLKSYIFFDAEPFIEFLREFIKAKRAGDRSLWIPIVIMDDVGSAISKYWMHIGETHFAELFSILDQLKEHFGILLLTARSFDSIPRRLRELTDLYATMTKIYVSAKHFNPYERADYYYVFIEVKWEKPGGGRRKGTLQYYELLPFGLRMPDEFWEKMIEARLETADKRLEKLVKIIKEKQGGESGETGSSEG